MDNDELLKEDMNSASPQADKKAPKEKHRLAKRIVISVLACLLAVATVGGAYVYFCVPITTKAVIPQYTVQPYYIAELTKKQAGEDATQMATFLEEVHPVFLQKPTAHYLKAKALYFAAVKKDMTVLDFAALTSRFLTTLNDGHTRISWLDGGVLSMNWSWVNGGLTVGSGSAFPKGAKIVSIGGVPVSKLAAYVDAWFPAENNAGYKMNREDYLLCSNFLSEAGASGLFSEDIKAVYQGRIIKKTVPFGSQFESQSNEEGPCAEGKIQNGVFIFTLHSCDVDSALNKTIASMKKAVAGGINKVIVDVRDNPGGNSDACDEILSALGMSHGTYGELIRLSKPAAKQDGYIRTGGTYNINPENSSKRNPKIKLYVLTNKVTFSSATMLAVWVRDGRLGTIVGQPSSNKPSCYGDIIYFQLKNSKLIGSVSHKKFIRPDASKTNESELVPDIVVPEDKDALQVALKKLTGKP